MTKMSRYNPPPNYHRFPYMTMRTGNGDAVFRPVLPLALIHRGKQVETAGLLDSGADVNVLPCRIGMELGIAWSDALPLVRLSGNLARSEARGIMLDAMVGSPPPIRLAFAWTRDEAVPLILGRTNFFTEFDVCFFQSRGQFEVRLQSTQP